MNAITYLAAPYSHRDWMIRHQRFLDVNRFAAHLMRQGKCVFSPISHGHPIAEASNLALGWDYWCKFLTPFLEASKEIYVLKLDGWITSVGVAKEVEIATALRIPITYADPK